MSYRLPSFNYYRGQATEYYDLQTDDTFYYAASQMDADSVSLLYQDGTDANQLLSYDAINYRIGIQTDSEELVGTQKTIVRDCDALKSLIELNLDVNILANTYPDFISEIENEFVLFFNEEYRYELPEIVDKEGNDEPEVYVSTMEDF